MKTFLPCLALVVIIGFSLFFPVMGQSGSTTAGITGIVTDQQQIVIAGATVTAITLQTGLKREVHSGDDGSFLITQVPPGEYELTVAVEGFATKTSRLDLVLGTTTLLNFTMEVGAASDVIEVKASSTIDEGKTESSTNMERDRIDSLPINRRNFLDFSLISPRVTLDRLPPVGSTATSGLSFNGQTARFNNITIDGLTNNDNYSGGVRSTFSQDAVQEFQVVSDNFSAEFGRAIGGVVNIVTRAGSKEFHGSLFFLNRNDKISAREVFSPTRTEFKQYQFGATLSGPIKSDRAFFFTSFERASIKQNVIVTISDDVVGSARRLGFPVSNGPRPFAVGITSLLGRVDLQVTPTDKLAVRYNGGFKYDGAFESSVSLGGLTSETTSGIQKLDDNTVVLNNTYINAGLNLVNETRFLYGRRNQDLLPIDPDSPTVVIVVPEGQVTFGRNVVLPQVRQDRFYQIVNNVSLTRGRQQLRFGVDFNYINAPGPKTFLPLVPGGSAFFFPLDFSLILGSPGLPSFTPLQTFDPSLRTAEQRTFLMSFGNILADSVPGFPRGLRLEDLSLPLVYIQGFGDPRVVVSERLFSTFFQGDFKLSSNLLLKAGIRYDINRLDFMPKNSGNFSPRLAFAYRPRSLEKLNIHGAYGLFFGAQPTVLSFATQQFKIDPPTRFTFIPFPFSIIPFALPNHRFPDSDRIPPSVNFVPQFGRVIEYDPNFRNGYAQQANFGLDYFLGNNTVVSVLYNFLRGTKLLGARNINTIVRPIPGDALTSQLTGRVDPSRGDIIEFESAFDSYYHSLTIVFNKRLTRGFGFLSSYTFSKGMDDFIDLRNDLLAPNDSRRPGDERALSVQDVRSRFVFSGTFDLSYIGSRLLRNFLISSIVNLESGRPYNLRAGVDLNLDGDLPVGDRPRIGGVPIGRNTGITPGFATLDLRLARSLTIGERYRIQVFGEAFNIFNRVNINLIDEIFPPDAQGNFNLPPKSGGRFIAPRERYRGAFAPRQFQIGFRLNF
jgi:hypothetical protein